MTETLAVFRFDSGKPGPCLLILGAIHGNEPCGTVALARLRLELETGMIALQSGSLAIAPICNPAAYKAGQRYVTANLNRIIARSQPKDHAEQVYAHQVMDLIDGCEVLLDLHSYTGGSVPFQFLDFDTKANRQLAKAQGIPLWVTGWPDLYKSSSELNAGDTTQYANSVGKTSILVECGLHSDPAAIAIAYSSCRRTLRHLGMAGYEEDLNAVSADEILYRVTTIITREKPGHFEKPWQHLDSIHGGDILCRYQDGGIVTAQVDGLILLPHDEAAVGAEWLYLGVQDS